ncbi:uncharacterized protein EDB91DRAFT_1087608 [Suillus paluster]|uniref:uncharacterized protein n=1 Tax=Suillus paluster TaxID=48578 RepID=UPI001B872853|nr:uncharacterized protein EDB91DRAFT_1087608 [Suillus paluster]KAG1724110.1 hypothetical protein EDB91DRAFT_1087608 [Suillus paluster]
MSNYIYNYPGSSESSAAQGPVAHVLEETFQCMWGYMNGLHCDELIIGNSLSTHLRNFHGVCGAAKLKLVCNWMHCGRELDKESLSRHIEEIHMGIVYFCECGKRFSRRCTLNNTGKLARLRTDMGRRWSMPTHYKTGFRTDWNSICQVNLGESGIEQAIYGKASGKLRVLTSQSLDRTEMCEPTSKRHSPATLYIALGPYLGPFGLFLNGSLGLQRWSPVLSPIIRSPNALM